MSGKPYTYESVEYSDGYYHTVFNKDGIFVAECNTEEDAKRFCEGVNGDMPSKGLE